MTNTEKTGVLAMTVIVIIILALVMTAGGRDDGPLTPNGVNDKVKIALEKKETPWQANPLDHPDLAMKSGEPKANAETLIDEKKLDDVFQGEWVDPNRGASKRRASASNKPKPAPRKSPTYREYTVRDGDTYTTIAQKQLGTMRRWEEIQALNPKISPRKLRAGMVIKIPVRRKRLAP